MSIEAMKQALDCLQAAYNLQQIDDLIPPHAPVKQAVASLRQAIEQAEKQEPVAWITDHGKGWLRWHSESDSEKNKTSISLYATPQPQRERVIFPTMLRKMWSGGEVQAWLDENVNKEKNK